MWTSQRFRRPGSFRDFALSAVPGYSPSPVYSLRPAARSRNGGGTRVSLQSDLHSLHCGRRRGVSPRRKKKDSCLPGTFQSCLSLAFCLRRSRHRLQLHELSAVAQGVSTPPIAGPASFAQWIPGPLQPRCPRTSATWSALFPSDQLFPVFPLLPVSASASPYSSRCSRRDISTMSAYTESTSTAITRTRELLNSLQLGAYINGVWLRAEDTDPSSLPTSLCSLLDGDREETMAEKRADTERDTEATFAVTDPATGDEIYRLPSLRRLHIRAAIAAAHQAQKSWGCAKQTPVLLRHHVLREWDRLVREEKETLAQIMSLESGKPLSESRSEVMYATSFIGWFGEQIRRDNGIHIPSPSGDKLMTAYRQPVGVCALITPWNFPAAMLTRKAAAAIAAGCCCVCKVPHDAPLTALYLARLAEKAGIPKGVLNVITADHPGAVMFGDMVCKSDFVRKISFTGSTAVGKHLMRLATDTVKRVSMELGGNAPFIVFEDAHIDEAVQAIVVCKFRGAGQTCVCANRVYVHRAVWDKVVPEVVKLVREQIVGHGLTHGVSIGPVIHQRAAQNIQAIVDDAVEHGAKYLLKGGVASGKEKLPEELKEGSFFFPTVLDCRALDGQEEQALREAKEEEHNKDGDKKERKTAMILQSEIFGPVLPLYSFDDEQDVIKRANATTAGLVAYICSRDMYRVRRVSAQLEAGMVGVNTGLVSAAEAPFGGVKESGVGREGSIYGLNEYTELKYVCVGGGEQ